MASWLTQNIGTILISLMLALIVGGIVYSMIKDKRKGRSSCGCGCANCAMAGKCHPVAKKKT
ncbi:MAG: FeoB-associated Cys-rich membrane protein [Clostridiales bacterium]|nr:FeoB-associated Cys-rich membrane protein [Clostridiales bacterium]